jgi:hypothetical protein
MAGFRSPLWSDRIFDVTPPDDQSGSFTLIERRLGAPHEKDYDAIDGEGPLKCQQVGGAAVAFDTPGLTMLEGRRDLAVLWDIRVSPKRAVGVSVPRSSTASSHRRDCMPVGS